MVAAKNHEDKFKCPALPQECIIPVLRKLIASQLGRIELHSSVRPCLKGRWTGIEGHIRAHTPVPANAHTVMSTYIYHLYLHTPCI